jgi:hypothetical protein
MLSLLAIEINLINLLIKPLGKPILIDRDGLEADSTGVIHRIDDRWRNRLR